jgi:CRP/FNR family nitrogen fixation transcriptional regulator
MYRDIALERSVGLGIDVSDLSKTLGDSLAGLGARIPYERNSEIFGEDEPADYVYVVLSGAVRTYNILTDGRRHIEAFHLAGDMFGLETGADHRMAAEAVVKSNVLVVKRSALFSQLGRDPELGAELWHQTARNHERARAHMLVLGRKTAQERLVAFLLEMSERLASKTSLDLPMSRQDIADYLGLTIETVSRMLTQLERDGLIGLPTCRHVELRDRSALRSLNS